MSQGSWIARISGSKGVVAGCGCEYARLKRRFELPVFYANLYIRVCGLDELVERCGVRACSGS